jgi:hypothetical protein
MATATTSAMQSIARRVVADNQYLWALFSCAVLTLQLVWIRMQLWFCPDMELGEKWFLYLVPTWLWLLETLRMIVSKYLRQKWQVEAMYREARRRMAERGGDPYVGSNASDLRACRLERQRNRSSILVLMLFELTLLVIVTAFTLMLLCFYLYAPELVPYLTFPVVAFLVVLALYILRLRAELFRGDAPQ